MAEGIHDDWQTKNPDHQLVIVRPAVVFGPGEGGNFTRLAKLLSRGFFVFPGRRDTIKSCIYVKTLVDWMMVALAKDEPRIIFNGSYEHRYTIEQIVDAFREVAFPRIRKITVPSVVLRGIAAVLSPISSATGLGIHPDRITKLMVSTNVLPSWAVEQGLTVNEDVSAALREWSTCTKGQFK
jgi:nucleoside-diphosphate-sugar epimerase